MPEIEQIQIMRPRLPAQHQLRKNLRRIDRAGIYSNFGPLNHELLEGFAEHFRIPISNMCTVTNATLGLEGAIRSSSPSAGTWSLPSWTFTATAAAAINSGESIEFLDVDGDWRVVPSSGTKNLIDVLPFGDQLRIDRLPNNLDNLIIDAAASVDTLYFDDFFKMRKFGLVVSLHATKLIQAGEGGLFISNDSGWVERFKSWSNFGMDGSRTSLFVGSNAKMSEYASAIGLASLKNWKRDRQDWLSQSNRAYEISNRFGLKVLNPMAQKQVTPYWIIKSEKIERIKQEFELAGIPYRSWWESGCHEMPAYSKYQVMPLPNTELATKNSLGLPFHLFLNNPQWKRIETSLEKACH